MNPQDMSEFILQLIRWLLISAGIGVPLFFCGYVLFSPTYRLEAAWQNFRMRRQPHRALKDRHFKGLRKKIRVWKVVSFFAFFIFLWLALLQFHVDLVALIGNISK
ncbi:MAG TPA: hypothetical protein VK737_00375 [Opitutales bacterium]|jgi:hypothetical protein|nr:hypothetical protein [Opitutales bacterium]